MENYNSYKDKNNQFFNQLLSNETDEHLAIGNSKQSHEKRFDKVLEIGNIENSTLLDVGCGLGGFYNYAKAKKIQFEYKGFDINDGMISNAKLKNNEIEGAFEKFDILDANINNEYDFAISIGPLNLNLNEQLNYELTFKMIEKLFQCAKIGCAISMTSIKSLRKNGETFYYDSKKIVEFVEKFCNNYRLDHSYLPHDFTVFLYKDDFYSNK